ncbi:hypothetical protein V6N11_058313 [Hibiscus sabdariffa]|uniref:Uncharacterized protein n=1 Tax=Hibiscus sabdariffa TaxID=183260 RepID=A0ABR2U3Y5_9ROSI
MAPRFVMNGNRIKMENSVDNTSDERNSKKPRHQSYDPSDDSGQRREPSSATVDSDTHVPSPLRLLCLLLLIKKSS